MNGEDTNIINATLYDQPLPLLLDTGVQISVIPEELVAAAAKTGRNVQLKVYKVGYMKQMWLQLDCVFGRDCGKVK